MTRCHGEIWGDLRREKLHGKYLLYSGLRARAPASAAGEETGAQHPTGPARRRSSPLRLAYLLAVVKNITGGCGTGSHRPGHYIINPAGVEQFDSRHPENKDLCQPMIGLHWEKNRSLRKARPQYTFT